MASIILLWGFYQLRIQLLIFLKRRDGNLNNSNYKLVKTDCYTVELYLDYYNERLCIVEYCGNRQKIVSFLLKLVKQHHFSKIIFYARSEHWQEILSLGFMLEAVFKGFFNGKDAYAMVLYMNNERKTSKYWIEEDNILRQIYAKGIDSNLTETPQDYMFGQAVVDDVEELAVLYGQVFEMYPTPVKDPDFLRKFLDNGNVFYIVKYDNKIVSAASAEVNMNFLHAELTDCVTLPEHRKHGLMKKLLLEIEEQLRKKGIYFTFSIARALSFGINAAFYQLGYEYGGRMTNNCYIFDKIEDMNVWVKDLSEVAIEH